MFFRSAVTQNVFLFQFDLSSVPSQVAYTFCLVKASDSPALLKKEMVLSHFIGLKTEVRLVPCLEWSSVKATCSQVF